MTWGGAIHPYLLQAVYRPQSVRRIAAGGISGGKRAAYRSKSYIVRKACGISQQAVYHDVEDYIETAEEYMRDLCVVQ